MKLSMKKVPKKWYSGLAIVAFLALSVMTAYNIRIGSDAPKTQNTAGQEELKKSKDTIGSVVVPDSSGEHTQNTRENQDDGQTQEQTEEDDSSENISDQEEENILRQREEAEEESDEETEKTEETSQNNETTQEQDKKSTFHYNGEKTLEWPVVGNIILPYSMDTTVYYTTLDQYACNDGIMIGASKGQEVKAAADGRIVNIYESDRYGVIMTVLIGNYYEISYAQIEKGDYEIGDEVKQGDVLGVVAEPSRSFVLEGPHLFVKLTYKGTPVNPVDYLKS